MALQAIFERKPSDFCLQDFEVSKTIRLPAEVFEDVLKNPIQDYDFIRENIDLMRSDSNGVYHCLLLTGEGRNDGLLVESESYGYCRYASYVPDASALTSPALQQFNQKLTEAVDYIVETGTQNTTKGNWIVSFDELEKQTEINLEFNDGICNVLVDMLSEREAVDDVELTDSGIDVCYYLDFCPNYSAHPEETVPEPAPAEPLTTLRDLLHTRWEDIHLMHKDVELEVPHTIVELDGHTLTDAGKEAWQDVLNAAVIKVYSGYYGLQIELDKVKPRRLEEFSAMLAGYCPVSDYEKWVAEEAESPTQSPEMKL